MKWIDVPYEGLIDTKFYDSPTPDNDFTPFWQQRDYVFLVAWIAVIAGVAVAGSFVAAGCVEMIRARFL